MRQGRSPQWVRHNSVRHGLMVLFVLPLVMVLMWPSLDPPARGADAAELEPSNPTVAPNGSVAGLLWVDGNGTPPNGWNGLQDAGEPPLPDYPVALYLAGALASPVAQVVTDADGAYQFDALEPGSYVVGVASTVVGGKEYLLPMAAGNNQLVADLDSDPVQALSAVIEVDGQAVTSIDAGMRLPMGIRPMAGAVEDFNINLNSPAAVTGVILSGSNPNYTLTFDGSASGNTYRLYNTMQGSSSVATISIGAGVNTEFLLDAAWTNAVVNVAPNASLTIWLKTGTTSTLNANINVPTGATLTINSSAGTGSTAGTLNMGGASSTNYAAIIGGLSGQAAGTINIDGGTLDLKRTGVSGAAVIGGGGGSGSNTPTGTGGAGGSITITGGQVTATGSTDDFRGCGAGIGGGYNAGAGTITIAGGTVTTTGSGASNAIGAGAGIGSGSNGSGGSVTIGGTAVVTATGGGNAPAGAGIGAGSNGTGGTVVINGHAVVTAKAGGNATSGNGGAGIGIGGGTTRGGGSIAITGNADVTAWGRGNGAGIGGWSSAPTTTPDPGADLTIDATATVTAYANNAAAISIKGTNAGTAYWVSGQFQLVINETPGPTDRLEVFIDGGRSTPFITLTPAGSLAFGFVRPGMTQRTDYYIDVYNVSSQLQGNVFRSTDKLSEVYSINQRAGYHEHLNPLTPNGEPCNLEVSLDKNFRVVYKGNGGVTRADPSKDYVLVNPLNNGSKIPVAGNAGFTHTVVNRDDFYAPDGSWQPAVQAFLGWNTMPDGTGVWRQPGDVINSSTSIVLFAQWSQGTFDLSQTVTWAGTDIDIYPSGATGTAGMYPYYGGNGVSQYRTDMYPYGGDAVNVNSTGSGAFRKLTFNNTADGKTYQVIQSGCRSQTSIPGPLGSFSRPKEKTAIFNSIVVASGVRVTLEIDDIDMVGNIDVQSGATLTLLLKNTGALCKPPTPVQPNYPLSPETNLLWGSGSVGGGSTISGAAGSTINVKATSGGKLKLEGATNSPAINSAGRVVIASGTINAKATAAAGTIQAAVLDITGGDLEVDGCAAISGGQVTVSGGTTNASCSAASGVVMAVDDLTVSAGTLNVNAIKPAQSESTADGLTVQSDLTVNGGNLAVNTRNGNGVIADTVTVTAGSLIVKITDVSTAMVADTVTISGGTVEGWAYGNGVDGLNARSVTISGGQNHRFQGNLGAGIRAATVDISAGSIASGGAEYGVYGTTVTITGGTLTALAVDAGPAQGGLVGSNITISGGTVKAIGQYKGAAINGALVEISQGPGDPTQVTATANANLGVDERGGAGIGSGVGLTSGTVTISGGKVTATGASGAAGIGGGAGGAGGSVSITGGTVTAKSGLVSDSGSSGAGIGGGAGGAGGSVTITGGTVTATGGKMADAGISGAGIGGGGAGAPATVTIGTGASVAAYSYGDLPAIHAGNNNAGNSHYVNATLTQAIPGSIVATLQVTAPGSDTALNTLELPVDYRGFAYSTQTTAKRTDEVWAYNGATKLGDIVRVADDGPVYSMKALADYNPHQTVPQQGKGWLPVKFRDYYQVTEKYVDLLGNPLPGVPDTNQQFKLVNNPRIYSTSIPAVAGWVPMGYYVGEAFPPQSGTYTTGDTVTINPVDNHHTVFFVYIDTTDLTVSKIVTGPNANKTRSFLFAGYFFDDAAGTSPAAGTSYGFTKTGPGLDPPVTGQLEVKSNHRVVFALKDGETITIHGVPLAAYVQVTERPDDKYDTRFQDSIELDDEPGTDTAAGGVGPRLMTVDRGFVFTNTRIEVPVTSFTSNDTAYAGLIGVGASLVALAVALSLGNWKRASQRR